MSLLSYTPAFLEVFLGFVLVVVWARRLERRAGHPRFVRWLTPATALAVVAGQAVGMVTVIGDTMTSGLAETVRMARLGSAGAVVGALLLCVVATVLQRRQRARSTNDPNRDRTESL